MELLLLIVMTVVIIGVGCQVANAIIPDATAKRVTQVAVAIIVLLAATGVHHAGWLRF